MKYLIVGALVLSAQVSFAQVLKLKEIRDDSGRWVMAVESTERPAVAKKINSVIFPDWGYDPTNKVPFLGMMIEDDYGNEIQANNDRVLSVTMERSHTGCGLHLTRYDYIFDARTGAAIDEGKLFGPEGLVKVRKLLFKAWKASIANAIKEGSRVDEYKACIDLATTEKQSEKDARRMVILDNAVKFWAASDCLEGTAYDFEADEGNGPYTYSVGHLLPMLTPYGYSLFFDKASGPVSTLMRGTIDGKYPISLTILPGKETGTLGGMIVYDRIGEPINLSGTMNGNQVVLHELDNSNTELSNIEVSWDGTKLTGSFINLKSKKQMPFVASVVK